MKAVLKQRSKKLEELLKRLNSEFKKLDVTIEEIFTQGRAEGFTDKEIGDWIRERMKGNYTKQTISRVLPETAKNPKMDRNKIVNKKLTNENTNATNPTLTPEAEEHDEAVQTQYGKFQIKPDEYLIEDLNKYDTDLLIKIIKHLDKKVVELAKVISVMSSEIQRLKK